MYACTPIYSRIRATLKPLVLVCYTAKTVKNGPQIVKNGQKRKKKKQTKTFKMVNNYPQQSIRSNMAKNIQKISKTVKNGKNRSKMVDNGQQRLKTVSMVKNGQKRLKTVKNSQ